MAQDYRLDRLLTYTTFHIGVYISLLGAVIGVDALYGVANVNLLKFSATCFLLAGVFGGAIGSNIPEAKSFETMKIRVFFIPFPPLRWCIHLEHGFFWVGIGFPVFLYLFFGIDALKAQSNV